MEVVSFLHVLWRRRLLVVVGLVVALALGFVAGREPASSYGTATSRVLLDTPRSVTVENAPFGAETLPWRANLIVHLIGSEDAKRRLARELGIRPDRLAVVDVALSVPDVRASMPKAAAEAALPTGAPYVLTVSQRNLELPIVYVEADAPDRRRAARLAGAAADLMKAAAPPPGSVPDYSYEVAEDMASAKDPRVLQGFVVEDFGPVRSKTVEEDHGPVKAAGVSLIVLALWCVGLVLAPAARSLWR